ncbi:hypothetical protein ACJ72_00327 [Emergomyces africanus]|uniref:Uncharacterized protein n=1 Tax=Emergomyces africanus TaxID=1955775 RepID=A0A1B7P8T9_9EURO|nr:hypothetical protein ACJ72_00327 [Emergomyces africanus]
MHFIGKLSASVIVAGAAFTGALPIKEFGYRAYEVQPNGGNAAATGQYPASPLPSMSILPVSPSVDPIQPPSNSPVATSYGPPSVTSGFPTDIPADYTLPASLVTSSYGPPSVTSGFPTAIPPDYSIPAIPVTESNGPPSITAEFPTAIPTDYSSPGPRTVTVRPLPVSSGSSVDPIRTISNSSASPATPTYGPPLVTSGFPTRLPVNKSIPIATKTVTLTYTLGTGVVTTVVTRTVVLTDPPAQYPTLPPDTGVDPVSEATTTLSLTSTTTVTITLAPTPTTPNRRPNRPGIPAGPPCRALPVVTVTKKETVTVTATPSAVEPTFDNPSPTEPVTPPPYPTTPSDDDDDDDDDEDEDEDKVFSALPIASPSVTHPTKGPRPPYPTGTTAVVEPTASSGFFTRIIPMPTGGHYHGMT